MRLKYFNFSYSVFQFFNVHLVCFHDFISILSFSKYPFETSRLMIPHQMDVGIGLRNYQSQHFLM